LPRIRPGLLQAEADPLVRGIERQHDQSERIAFLHDFAGMADALPADFADREQAFNAFFDLDERAETFDLGDAASDRRAGTILRFRADPRVGHRLLERETELSGFAIDADDFDVNQIADFYEIAGLDAAAMA